MRGSAAGEAVATWHKAKAMMAMTATWREG